MQCMLAEDLHDETCMMKAEICYESYGKIHEEMSTEGGKNTQYQ